MNDAFGKILTKLSGRIVNVSSSTGPIFMQRFSDQDELKQKLAKPWLLRGGVHDVDDVANYVKNSSVRNA